MLDSNAHAESRSSLLAEQPLLSVIVPIYNVAPFLDQCLLSIAAQSYRNLEIICINDGSTDNSLELIQKHAQSDARFRVIDKENQGYGASCNRGLREARGDYVTIVEPDDWIEPDAYRDLLAYAAGFSEEIDIIKSAYWRIVHPDTPRQRKLNCSYKNRVRPPHQPFTLEDAPHLLRHHPSIWSALYRADFLRENGIQFREIPGAGWADNPFQMETLGRARSIIYLDKAYYCYREESPEKAAAFAQNNTLLPFERWIDMQEIMEEIGIDDTGLIRAFYRRGFRSCESILGEVGLGYPGVREAATRMFSRMDKSLVFSDDEIPPGSKHLFAELLELPAPKINRLAYAKALAGEALYTLSNTGLRNTLHMIAKRNA